MKNPIVLIVGTRPDAIKLVPVYKALKRRGAAVLLCATNQHKELLDQVFQVLDVVPDACLEVMKENQNLTYVTQAVLEKTQAFYNTINPKLVVVQGDTTSSFAAALAAFYAHIPIAHVEAGLRTSNIQSPFPEEANRIFISRLSSLHFAPTPFNVSTLLTEGTPANTVFCVGNTVIDALFLVQKKIHAQLLTIEEELKNRLEKSKQEHKKIVLLTTHRRESFNNQGTNAILEAIAQYATAHPDVCFFFPVHPNPNVRTAVAASGLDSLTNVFCMSPLTYPNLVYLLSNVDLVVTDSGGLQEESISLGKPLIVIRSVTERVETIWEGMAHLVGTDKGAILQALHSWHTTKSTSLPRFVYGDGKASERIATLLIEHFQFSTIVPSFVAIQDPDQASSFTPCPATNNSSH